MDETETEPIDRIELAKDALIKGAATAAGSIAVHLAWRFLTQKVREHRNKPDLIVTTETE